jgi:hypothetical protein
LPEISFDPRVLLPCCVAVVSLLLSSAPHQLEVSALVLLLVLLALLRRWAWLTGVAAAAVFMLGLGQLAGSLGSQGLTALFASLRFLWRYLMAGAFGMVLVTAVVPAQLLAALRHMHIPNTFTVPLMVMIRYMPALAENARAIGDATRVRGYLRGPSDLLLRPLAVGRYLVVPLLAVAIRSGDDLTAAALTRGLAVNNSPTTITELRLTAWDALLLIGTVAVVIYGFGVLG